MTTNNPKAVIVIFGATGGDLANRKLYPSIYRLYRNGKLSDNFAVIGVARRPWTNEVFRDKVKESIENFNDTNIDPDEFASHFHYNPFDIQDLEHYEDLDKLINELDDKYEAEGNRLFYFSMAPNFFGTLAANLKSEGLTTTKGWTRLVIEKPFGHDFKSAKELNKQIRETFTEDQIYRIDHYLGKEMVQNIEVIRFANALFEPLWNNQYISNIQITSSEVLGVEERGRYYDGAGALKDMMQNHMLQMLALIAMDPPIKLTPEEIRSEKVKVLRALRVMNEDEVDKYFVRGQYDKGIVNGEELPSYREGNGVDPESNTETFVAAKLMIDNFRWAGGVPFYIRTGKRMKEKSTEIVVEFKDLPMNLYYGKEHETKSNLLVIHVQPHEGITLHVNAKKGDYNASSTPITLSYDNKAGDKMNTPEAYEILLHDCMRGDSTNFTHWDEVAFSWKFIDVITNAWSKKKADFPNYNTGSNGPKEADQLLLNDGFEWWDVTPE
ncbi:glucose-6-phosphate 1-dehydrogenase [Gracilibacillus boraciitolerans JCM 21714]|uniref:Glucose-6-phosphate 1-dehydrogenase n=1 Tax=Gracilibacillus boraciitolerans JCM 21714 TaxID=1298598 RepID=W4VMR8_9BACI|nr:glucose-6-phosphate dehydrogenase [Gracilibacillus boraciitolerans]GAE94416.1 glucose-6-phosphate 1-dehydrogenase [Gracilibacillus boraciitolerans JCM 21714]